jgi:hypothetical protein
LGIRRAAAGAKIETVMKHMPMHSPALPRAAAPSGHDASLARLALRLVAALLRLAWRHAERVLSVGDCNVH